MAVVVELADPALRTESLDQLDEGVRLRTDCTEDLTLALERLPLDQPHERRFGSEDADVRCDDLFQQFRCRHARVLGARARRRQGRLCPSQDAIENFPVQPLLRAEEVPRRAARQSGLPTDLLEARTPVAARREEPFRGVENGDASQRP